MTLLALALEVIALEAIALEVIALEITALEIMALEVEALEAEALEAEALEAAAFEVVVVAAAAVTPCLIAWLEVDAGLTAILISGAGLWDFEAAEPLTLRKVRVIEGSEICVAVAVAFA